MKQEGKCTFILLFAYSSKLRASMKKVLIILILIQGIALAQFTRKAYFDPTENTQSTAFNQMQGVRTIIIGNDLNKNGKQELIATDLSNGGNVHVFELSQDGKLEIIWSSPDFLISGIVSVPRWVQTGDLDGDTNLEIIFPRGYKLDGEIQVWEYDGNGGFGTEPAISLQEDHFNPIIGNEKFRMNRESAIVFDFDYDGKDELITATTMNNVYIIGIEGKLQTNANWHIEGGDPMIHPENGFSSGNHWHSFPCDYNGDGVKEIVNFYWSFYGFWSISPQGFNQYRYPTPVIDNRNDHYSEFLNPAIGNGVAYFSLSTPDVDGDGNEEIAGIVYGTLEQQYDIALVNFGPQDEGVYVWENTPEHFGWITENLSISTGTELSLWAIEEFDFNCDGKDEIYIGGERDMALSRLIFNGGDVLDKNSYSSEILASLPEEYFFVEIYDSLGLHIDTNYFGNAFVTKVVAGMDLDNNGKREIALSLDGVSDSITYRYFEWDVSNANYTLVDILKLPVEHAENILVYEYESIYIPPDDWNVSLSIRDAGGKSVQILNFGQNQIATDGIDLLLEEEELAAVPPAGEFDSRFILPDPGATASLKDMRNIENTIVVWECRFQEGSSGLPITIEWNISDLPSGVFKLTDIFGGTAISIDMKTLNSYSITDHSVHSLNIIAEIGVIIPVEISSFSANVVGETIQLVWETATETNNKGFEVERSSDNETFTQIGKIDGHGTTAEKQSYNFTDHNATSGTYYYRLRQVDFDGTSTYSDVVEVEFIPTEYSLGQNYPNPFNPSTKVKFAVPVESKVTVTLYNMLGQKVKELVAAQYNVGLHEVELNASDLASGMYIYSITALGVDGSNFVDTKKMMLMK